MNRLLTLAEIARNPTKFVIHFVLATGEQLILRPLIASDVEKLARFFTALSPESRRLSTFASYDRATAQELCDAIARYDKLRFAVVGASAPEQPIVGLMEFSFDLTSGDVFRYTKIDYPLNPATDCRFGPTLADDWQNRGVGSLLLPPLWEIARRFGRTRVILWGGVLADNARAIRFYEKNGFRLVGRFVNGDGLDCCDMIIVLDEQNQKSNF